MRRFSQTFNRRVSQPESPRDPVLTPEDEAFFQRLIARPDSGDPAPLPDDDLFAASPVGEDAQNTPLPPSPTEESGTQLDTEIKSDEKVVSELSTNEVSGRKEKKRRPWSRIWRIGSVRHKNGNASDGSTRKPSGQGGTNTDKNDDKMPDDMTDILERLNLSSDNNHVFSINDETQDLLRRFKLVFKDLVNGVPTAYNDLESLLTNGNKQLQQSYSQLPGFVQKLIEKLPEKLAKTFGPEALAAASEQTGTSSASAGNMGKAAAAAGKVGISLKELVGNPAAIAGMLRSIMSFLKARFPAAMGMNALWSLALFILLFVLWYCHKRGREVRLENERVEAEEETGKSSETAEESRDTEDPTAQDTPQEASESPKEPQQSREVVVAKPEPERKKENRGSIFGPPTRTKSKLGLWSKKDEPATNANIAPYPGT